MYLVQVPVLGVDNLSACLVPIGQATAMPSESHPSQFLLPGLPMASGPAGPSPGGHRVGRLPTHRFLGAPPGLACPSCTSQSLFATNAPLPPPVRTCTQPSIGGFAKRWDENAAVGSQPFPTRSLSGVCAEFWSPAQAEKTCRPEFRAGTTKGGILVATSVEESKAPKWRLCRTDTSFHNQGGW